MEQRDLIKDQIEQLGKVLGKILGDFLGFKSNGQIEQGIENMNEQLIAEFDIDIDELVVFSQEELKTYLTERKMASGHFETLGKCLKEMGESEMSVDNNKAKTYLTKSLELLDLEDEVSNILSMERMNLKSQIENTLKQLA